MNFLVILVDEMQSASLGCNGNPDVKTPNIDELAQRGVNFPNAYCSNPVCMPSRSTIITGLTPRQHGCLTNGSKLPLNVPTVGRILQKHQYKTACFGKFHYQPFYTEEPHDSSESAAVWERGGSKKLPPDYYGFEKTYFVGGHVKSCFGEYKQWLNENYPEIAGLYQRENGHDVADGITDCYKISIPPELHYNNVITDECMAFLDEMGSGESFFAVCSFPDPHFPFVACSGYADMYDKDKITLPENWNDTEDPLDTLASRRKLYRHHGEFTEDGLRQAMAQTYGMITHIDDNVGRLVKHLKNRGLYDDTVIVFMADHGDYLGGNHLVGKDVWPYETVYKVPFIWSAPDGACLKCGTPVSLLDFVPTVLGFAGIDVEEMKIPKMGMADQVCLPGRDLSDYITKGGSLETRPVLIEYDEDWHKGPFYRIRSLVYGVYKLTVFDNGGGLLYDLEKDPHENENLYEREQYKNIKMVLMTMLVQELSRTDRIDSHRICGA